ncbi:MAG: DUF202 domain-containing protein [Faecalicoccus sp.]|nr:DUF202 domain-containing protein [Faecalicoccus sp.]
MSSKFEVKDQDGLTIRDILAFHRTELASERTLLSYFRTFIGLEGAAAGLVKLFSDVAWSRPIARILMVLGPIILVIGLVRYFRLKGKLDKIMTIEKEAE